MADRKERAVAIAHDFLQSGIELPFSSEVGPKLLSLSGKSIDQVEVEKLVRIAEVDPGLVTKFLQLANSVYFSGITKIVSLRRAIIQIGLEEAINFIHIVYFKSRLPQFPDVHGFSDKDYWGHSWACAIANKMLGHPSVGTNILPGELYITGLLHGLGKLVLATRHPKEFAESLEVSRDFHQPIPEAQLDVLGTTDGDVACELLKAWQLPENICQAIKHYHAPGLADKEYQEIAGLTQFAYFLANTSGVGNVMDEFSYDIKQTWIAGEAGSPLSDSRTQSIIVNEVYSALKSKSESLLLFVDSDEGKVEEIAPVTGGETREVTKKSTLSSFLSWLRSIFS